VNRINPIYIAILLLVMLALVSFKLGEAKRELNEAKDTYTTTLQLSTDLSALKEVYADKTKIKKSLQRVLNNPSLRSSKIIQKFKHSSAMISSENMDVKALNLMMSKFLNNSYNITSLNIKRLSDRYVSFDMEIQW